MDWTAKETIVAIATPPGKGGVAIVRISGKLALEAGLRVFQCNTEKIESHHLYYGRFFNPATKQQLDAGLFAYMRGPNSYTGEDVVELHCHGGFMVPKSLVTALLELNDHRVNLRQAMPGEFTFRAHLNRRLDLAQAEAVEELISAQSGVAQQLAIQRLEGTWRATLDSTINQLINIIANFEADLDFPDEQMGTSSIGTRTDEMFHVKQLLTDWLKMAAWQQQIQEPLIVCLAGPSNVGKSTLFNQLLNEERALVDAQPGTTRDYLDAVRDIGGATVRLVDTAGFRNLMGTLEAVGPEAQGMVRSERWIQQAGVNGLLFWVDDPVSITSGSAPEAMAKVLKQVNVINKIDLISDAERKALQHRLPNHLLISAREKIGLEQITTLITATCHERNHRAEQTTVYVNARQQQAMQRALEHLDEAITLTNEAKGDELVAQELWSAVRALEEVSGKEMGPEVVESIFKNFCVGK